MKEGGLRGRYDLQGPRLLREVLIAGRFAIVGLGATAVHLTVVWLLVGKLLWPAVASNTLAFMVALGVSFSGHYFWTFRRPGHMRRALFRFLGVSISTFAFDTLVLAYLLRSGVLTPLFATIASAALVPVISLVVSRLWCFVGD
jgi:putative flippase GtrA